MGGGDSRRAMRGGAFYPQKRESQAVATRPGTRIDVERDVEDARAGVDWEELWVFMGRRVGSCVDECGLVELDRPRRRTVIDMTYVIIGGEPLRDLDNRVCVPPLWCK